MPRWPTSSARFGTGARSDRSPSAMRSAVPIISSIGRRPRRTVNQTKPPARTTASRQAATTVPVAVRTVASTSSREIGGRLHAAVGHGREDDAVLQVALDGTDRQRAGGRPEPGHVGQRIRIVGAAGRGGVDDLALRAQADVGEAGDVEGRLVVPGGGGRRPKPGRGPVARAWAASSLSTAATSRRSSVRTMATPAPPVTAATTARMTATSRRRIKAPGAARTRTPEPCGSGRAPRRPPSCAGRRCSSRPPRRSRRSRTARRGRGSGSSTAPAPG